MREAVVAAGPTVTIRTVDFPKLPGPDHIIIKVVVSGSNPKTGQWPNDVRYPLIHVPIALFFLPALFSSSLLPCIKIAFKH